MRLRGLIQPDTSYVYDLRYLSQLLKREILGIFDHQNLNLDMVDFRDLNSTA